MVTVRPSKVNGVLRILLVGFIFGFLGSGLLAIKLHHDDTRGPPKRIVPPAWFYFAFPLGLGTAAALVFLGIFIRDTQHRRSDPYRFSRRQFRFIELENTPLPNLSGELSKLGYSIFVESVTDNSALIEAGRVFVPGHFGSKKDPIPHKLNIKAIQQENRWHLSVECYPASPIVVADFRNTIYDSLEELMDRMSWRDAIKPDCPASLTPDPVR